MDRICQYSTIIFAGNVTVLLIVAVATDYWEYRNFRHEMIIPKLQLVNTTRIIQPIDTGSYVIVHYSTDKARLDRGYRIPGNNSHYQPPASVHQWWLTYQYVVTVNDTERNVTVNVTRTASRLVDAVVVLYTQYGNLFRDCDDLEAGVRHRLKLVQQEPSRCFNFILNGRGDDFISKDLPAVIHLERAAFLFAVICISTSIISLAGGCHGTLCRDKRIMVGASSTALTSGVALTFSIALFHGKCHLLHRRQFFADIRVPFQEEFNQSRTHSYGWSFVLAWICVVLCFVQSYVWLSKAQDLDSPFHKKKSRKKDFTRRRRSRYADDEKMLNVDFL